MDSHFIVFPGLGTFTIWSLSGCNRKSLGWHSNRTLSGDVKLCSVSDNVVRNLFKSLDVGRGQGDSDVADFLWLLDILLFFRHGWLLCETLSSYHKGDFKGRKRT